MYEQAGILSTEDGGLSVLAGSTLGGGTRVNWSASFRTPAHVRQAHTCSLLPLSSTAGTQPCTCVASSQPPSAPPAPTLRRREWAEQHGLLAFGGEAYDAALDAVCARLGVGTGVQHRWAGWMCTALRCAKTSHASERSNLTACQLSTPLLPAAACAPPCTAACSCWGRPPRTCLATASAPAAAGTATLAVLVATSRRGEGAAAVCCSMARMARAASQQARSLQPLTPALPPPHRTCRTRSTRGSRMPARPAPESSAAPGRSECSWSQTLRPAAAARQQQPPQQQAAAATGAPSERSECWR